MCAITDVAVSPYFWTSFVPSANTAASKALGSYWSTKSVNSLNSPSSIMDLPLFCIITMSIPYFGFRSYGQHSSQG